MNIKVYQRYLSFMYIKNFLIIFLALQFFYLGIDLMQYLKKLPNSANLQILYALYTFLNAINYTLPISLVIAMIISKFYLIKTNELIAMYASGISKNALIKPIVISSFLITLIYISLNFTSFAYSKEYAYNILTKSTLLNSSENLFFKYNDSYIYIKKLDALNKKAFDIKIFDTKYKDLNSIIGAKSAKFVGDYWILENINIIKKPKIYKKDAKLSFQKLDSLKMLKGFKPKIIENMYEGKTNFSIADAYNAIKLFLTQNVNTQKIKASLYSMIVFPFFAPLLNIILFYYLPISSRFFNIAIVSSIFIFISLATWAILFMLIKISLNGIVYPEVGIILPILFLALFAFYLNLKNR